VLAKLDSINYTRTLEMLEKWSIIYKKALWAALRSLVSPCQLSLRLMTSMSTSSNRARVEHYPKCASTDASDGVCAPWLTQCAAQSLRELDATGLLVQALCTMTASPPASCWSHQYVVEASCPKPTLP
jgi:hypothetical protein